MKIIRCKGFTLIEMAVVLVILGLMLSGLLIPMTEQIAQRDRLENQALLNDAKQALMGYTLSSRHLPCPDKTVGADNGDNDRPNDGREDFLVDGTCATPFGNLPTATLGLPATDAWQSLLIYRVFTQYANRPPNPILFNLNTPAPAAVTLRVCNQAACAAPRLTDNAVAIVISRGRNRGICAAACPDEAENNDGDVDFVSHPETAIGAPGGEFDDQVVWISRSVLMNNMVSAGLLP